MNDKSSEIFEARLCHVVKRADFDGYGFNLHAEKGRPGQYIGKVDEGSPAESAGLRQGDRIIEVNGVNIGSETHKQVVERIKSVANHTSLLVIDPKADIHNHQQLEAIERVKNGSNRMDHENNNNNKINHDEVETPKLTVESVADNGNSNGTTSVTTPTSETHSMQSNGSTPSETHADQQPSSDTSSTTITSTTTASAPSKSLNLSMTAAEMRAQLKSKKRPDPKTETLDVRKKYELIQKL
jgi:membrane-associated protease RseP (regulator of RpoE activity)